MEKVYAANQVVSIHWARLNELEKIEAAYKELLLSRSEDRAGYYSDGYEVGYEAGYDVGRSAAENSAAQDAAGEDI